LFGDADLRGHLSYFGSPGPKVSYPQVGALRQASPVRCASRPRTGLVISEAVVSSLHGPWMRKRYLTTLGTSMRSPLLPHAGAPMSIANLGEEPLLFLWIWPSASVVTMVSLVMSAFRASIV